MSITYKTELGSNPGGSSKCYFQMPAVKMLSRTPLLLACSGGVDHQLQRWASGHRWDPQWGQYAVCPAVRGGEIQSPIRVTEREVGHMNFSDLQKSDGGRGLLYMTHLLAYSHRSWGKMLSSVSRMPAVWCVERWTWEQLLRSRRAASCRHRLLPRPDSQEGYHEVFHFQCVRGGSGRPPSSLQGGLPNGRPPSDDDNGLDPEPKQPDPPAAHLLRCEHWQVGSSDENWTTHVFKRMLLMVYSAGKRKVTVCAFMSTLSNLNTTVMSCLDYKWLFFCFLYNL